MAKRTKYWSKMIEESGVEVRIYERANSDKIWISYQEGSTNKRRSLRTRDRAEADKRARRVAKEIARVKLTGELPDSLTLGQLFALYETHRVPSLTRSWARSARTRVKLFERAWGSDLDVSSVDQTRVDRYVDLRRTGKLSPFSNDPDGRDPVEVRDGTLDADFRWLSSCFNWARRFKVRGKRLLRENPLHDVEWPKERNPRRPVASHERFQKTMAQVDQVDPEGRLACILALARHTGRRENAICQLRASDLLLTKERMRQVLAEEGLDERLAEVWPNGAIRWSADSDKQGMLHIAPLGQDARRAVDEYVQRSARVGDTPLFPSPASDSSPIDRHVTASWLVKAEKLAGLPKLKGGTFHPYRRLWASERKHLPDVDVAAAGGWKDTRALKLSYQHADPTTMLRVVENQ